MNRGPTLTEHLLAGLVVLLACILVYVLTC